MGDKFKEELKQHLKEMKVSPGVGVFDIETNSADSTKAELKYFGFYSVDEDKYYYLPFTQKEAIRRLIQKHKVLIGFNNKGFDQPIIERFLDEKVFKYKIIIDLWEVSAPRGNGDFGNKNKNRIKSMGYDFPNYKLKTICEELELDDFGKGDIDYNIFRKDDWNNNEVQEIEKYIRQDLILTKKLFDWYEEQFKPLKELLNTEDQRKFKHINTTLASLSYAVICNQAGLIAEWSEEKDKPRQLKRFSGGHHINARWKYVKGNIIEVDFSSAYPHALMMGNLFSHSPEGWKGDGYYSINGCYDNEKQGEIEKALNKVFLERLKAKKAGDQAKNLSYKLVINSLYGLTGNWRFKTLYNPTTAGDCTHIVRTWLKKLAKHLEENGFICLYGFTDSIFVKVPKESNKEELMFIVNKVIEEFKDNLPFPLDTFNMDVEEEIKMIRFFAKNCYLFVTKNNMIKYKSTLLNRNTPKIIMNMFEDYMKPKIIKELHTDFTKEELETELRKQIKKDLTLATKRYRTKNLKDYNIQTSINYQISEVYGEGEHFLIPNLKNIGVGKSKSTKKKIAVRHCTIEEFQKNNLSHNDVDVSCLLKHIDKFIVKPKGEQNAKLS